jgi:hypothetical protein
MALTAVHGPFYAVLKSGVAAVRIVQIICDDISAELLLITMKVVCPDEAIVNSVG